MGFRIIKVFTALKIIYLQSFLISGIIVSSLPGIMRMNLSKRYIESCGPGALSGWNCTEITPVFKQYPQPSMVLSSRLMWVALRGGAGKRFLNDCISVVLRCDEHLTCGKLLDGMVAATMSGRDRPDFCTVCKRDELMSETDAEHRHFAAELTDGLNHFRHVLGRAWSVEDEHAVGLERHDLFCARVPGHYGDAAVVGIQATHHIVFHAAVDCHDVVFIVGGAGKPAFLAADLADEVGGRSVALICGYCLLLVGVERCR